MKWLFLCGGVAGVLRGAWAFGGCDFSASAKLCLAGGVIALVLAWWCRLVDREIARRRGERRAREAARLREAWEAGRETEVEEHTAPAPEALSQE